MTAENLEDSRCELGFYVRQFLEDTFMKREGPELPIALRNAPTVLQQIH